VIALRCTAKLLARIGPPQEPQTPTTTRLGDWYATPLSLGHRRLILAISERSRLPVLLAARDTKHLASLCLALALRPSRSGRSRFSHAIPTTSHELLAWP
jgi:hypothetical protein